MARKDKKQLSTDAIYAELGLDKDNKSTKELVLGDQAHATAVAQREETRLSNARDREAEKAAAAELARQKEEMGPLKFRRGPMGSLICGKPPEPKPAVVSAPSKNLPSSSSTAEKSATGSGRRPSEHPNVGNRGGGARKSMVVVVSEEHTGKPAAGLDGEPGQWRRMTAERYVDCYLNGGKHDPPAQSLMEEVDRQRQREGGYRNVSMFESGFVGKVLQPQSPELLLLLLLLLL
jgi:hypothetical protein